MAGPLSYIDHDGGAFRANLHQALPGVLPGTPPPSPTIPILCEIVVETGIRSLMHAHGQRHNLAGRAHRREMTELSLIFGPLAGFRSETVPCSMMARSLALRAAICPPFAAMGALFPSLLVEGNDCPVLIITDVPTRLALYQSPAARRSAGIVSGTVSATPTSVTVGAVRRPSGSEVLAGREGFEWSPRKPANAGISVSECCTICYTIWGARNVTA